ncbi:MAG: NUDIX hydrolase, partial [Bacteroidota bacterium]
LISIYYLVNAPQPYLFPVTNIRNDIPSIDGAQCFRWVPECELSEDEFTFPVDKYVVKMLKQDAGGKQ